MNGKLRKAAEGQGKTEYLKKLIQVGIFLYALLLFWVFPLYYQNKYFNMGEAKYLFFKWTSLGILPLLLFLAVLWSILHYFQDRAKKYTGPGEKSEKQIEKVETGGTGRRKCSVTDWFVLLYGIGVLLSFFLSDYQTEAVWGHEGWYMGLVSQLLFLAIYVLASRFFQVKRWFLHGICFASALVFLLAVLNRFQIDPLHFYDGLSIEQKVEFLSTIGQATWYSSYLCIVFPVGLYLYWNRKVKLEKYVYGCYIALGFATMVTQNSDSAFVAFALILLVLFLFSLESNEKMKRFLEILLIGLLAIKGIGILQLTFPKKAVPLENLSITASQGMGTTVLLAAVLVLYGIFCYLVKKDSMEIQRFRRAGYAGAILLGAGVFLFVLCMILDVKGLLPQGFTWLRQIDYFHFNDDWGNGRGFTWRNVAEIFQEYSFKNKLFGCGPDCFVSYAYSHYADTLSARWGSKVLTNAHNEWFTSLLFFGYYGLAAYGGIFLSTLRSCWKKGKEEPFLVLGMMSAAAYIGHNFFCYQQVVCTPLIFLIMGMVQNKKENCHAL